MQKSNEVENYYLILKAEEIRIILLQVINIKNKY